MAAMRAYDFINSMGIGTHLEHDTDSYKPARVAEQLAYLGINNIRVEAPYRNFNSYIELGQKGIRFDVISTLPDVAKHIAGLKAIAPYVDFTEGPNEINSRAVPYKGLSGAAAGAAYQKDLWNAVQAEPTLDGVAVLPFSLSVGSDITGYGDVSAYADYGNVHGYASDGVPPYYMLGYAVSSVTTTPGKQPMMTETGYYTLNNGRSGVTEDVQAKWLIDSFFENSASGVHKTYIYQLSDDYTDPKDDPENHYGLYTTEGVAKKSAISIHNLTTIMADKGANAKTFTPGAFDYTVSGLHPDYGFQKVYAKSDGSFDIALWSEPNFYNARTGITQSITPSNVTITLNGKYNVSVYDPIIGTGAVRSFQNVSTFDVALGTDPLVVEVKAVSGSGTPVTPPVVPPPVVPTPPPGPTPVPIPTGPPAATPAVTLGSGADTITVSISQDAWQGDAQFTLRVDGKQVGGTQTAKASHGQGQSQAFNLQGNFGPGKHTVEATFLNDAFGGTAATDRNLYVDKITAGGTTTTLNSALLAAGTKGFAVTLPAVPAPVPPAPVPQPPAVPPAAGAAPSVTVGTGPDKIVVGISQDAWQGDAQFTLSVDGKQVGGTQVAKASHALGQSQAFTVQGTFGPGSHSVTANFLNDAYAGTAATDRNLYVDSITAGGTKTSVNTALMSAGSKSFTAVLPKATAPGVTLGSGADRIVVGISQDEWQGDAQFTLKVDGKQIGGVQTAKALHNLGESQAFTLAGDFGPGAHTIAATFLNDAWGGKVGLDRNLFVDSITAGNVTTKTAAVLLSAGTKTFSATIPISTATVATGQSSALAFISSAADARVDGTVAGGLSLVGTAGRDVFRLQAGQSNGTVIKDFATDLATGDMLELVGYGAGARFEQVDPSTWRASSASGGMADLISFTNPAPLVPANYAFA